MDSKDKYIALLVFSIISLAFCFPIFKDIQNYGVGDWDVHFVYYEAPRKAISQFGQFPLWNPYYCGGNVLLGHPESPFLSPGFLANLLFGTVIGLKIQVLLHLIAGMFGMYLLARRFGSSRIVAYLPALVFFLSSWYPLRMNAGHTLYMSFAYLPFAMLFFLKAKDDSAKYFVLSALFLALMFLSGGTYPFIFSAMFLCTYAALLSVQKKAIKPFAIAIMIIVLAIFLSSVKFFPVMQTVSNNPLEREDMQPMSMSIFYDSFFSRSQLIESRVFEDSNNTWAWHEYGSFIGFAAFLLFLISLMHFSALWPLIASTALFALFSLGNFFFLWPVLNSLPFFSQLIAPSRMGILVVFGVALLAGAGLTWLNDNIPKKKSWAIMLIMLIVAAEIFTVSFPIWGRIFQAKPVIVREAPVFMHVFLAEQEKFNMMFPTVKAGFGVTNCYEKMHVPAGAIPALTTEGYKFANYPGQAFLLNENRTLLYDFFSPNRIVLSPGNSQSDILVVNMNYDSGWKASYGTIKDYNNMLAVEIGKPTETIVLSYRPWSFVYGAILSLLAIIAAVLLFIWPKKLENLKMLTHEKSKGEKKKR